MGWELVNSNYAELRALNGGVNSNKILNIRDNESPDCLNWYYYGGALRRLFGSSKYSANKVNGDVAVTGIYQFRMRDDTTYLIATAGTKITYYDSLTDAWIDITGGLTITAGHRFSFCTMNDMVIATNGVDEVIKWTGTGDAALLGGSPPKAKYCKVYANYLLLGNCIESGTPYPVRVYRSGINSPETWDTTNDYWNFENSRGSHITQIAPMGNKVVVYHTDTISYATGRSTNTFAIFPDAIPGIGCVDGHSLSEGMIPSKSISTDEILPESNFYYAQIFRSYDGYYAFDGGTVKRISDNLIQDNANLNMSQLENCCGVFYPPYNQYWSFLTYTGDTTNNYGYLLDMMDGGWWPHEGFAGFCLSLIKESNQYKVLYGGYDGYVYYLNPSVYTINTASMTNYWYSKWFDITRPDDIKLLRELIFFIKTIGNYTLKVYLEFDLPFGGRSQLGSVSLATTGSVYPGVYGTSVYSASGVKFLEGSLGGDAFNFVRLKIWMEDDVECAIEKIGLQLQSIGSRRIA